jgi:hypothetical protein
MEDVTLQFLIKFTNEHNYNKLQDINCNNQSSRVLCTISSYYS